MGIKQCFKGNWLTPVIFVVFVAGLAAVTFYNRYPTDVVIVKPTVIEMESLELKSLPIDITILSRSDFKPIEYISHTIERDNNTYTVKCDLIDDIPEAFELRLYLSKSYDKLIKESLRRTWLWQLGPNNEFSVVEPAIRLAPSIDDIGLFMGFRWNHGKDPNGHYRLVIEFECEKEINEDSSCVILAGYITKYRVE